MIFDRLKRWWHEFNTKWKHIDEELDHESKDLLNAVGIMILSSVVIGSIAVIKHLARRKA